MKILESKRKRERKREQENRIVRYLQHMTALGDIHSVKMSNIEFKGVNEGEDTNVHYHFGIFQN